MSFKEYLNDFYLRKIDSKLNDPTLHEWCAWIWLSVFYTATRSKERVLDTVLNSEIDFITLRTQDNKIQLNLYVDSWVVLVKRSNWKTEILEDLDSLIQLTYWIR